MGIGLALKRVYHSFDPSPRRWVRKNLTNISFYAIGLFTGLMASGHPSTRLFWFFLAAFSVLVGLKWWSGVDREVADKKLN